MPHPEIKVIPDPEHLATEAAERIVLWSAEAIRLRGAFSIALSGGNTPKALFQLLATDPYPKRIDFTKWDVFFSDERCVPPAHKDSNFRMADEALFDHVNIPYEQIHRMKGEIEPQQAAIEYGQILKEKFGEGGLDLILLGMGEEGHTASLFPETAALDEKEHRCVANFVPKLNTWRITMTAPFINRARQVMVMVEGAAKAVRVAEILEGPLDPHRLPIQMIDPSPGHLLWLMDAAAAGMHEDDEESEKT
jgi:6-phosphogluconolactonase